jgi:hypothetical protein
MKKTRVLLADNSGVLCAAAQHLSRMLPNLSTGDCTVRSAEGLEPLTWWHPDLVLLDPNRDEGGGTTPAPQTKARSSASRVLVLSLSYDREVPRLRSRSRRAQAPAEEHGPWRLASATVQAVEMDSDQPAEPLEPALPMWSDPETKPENSLTALP